MFYVDEEFFTTYDVQDESAWLQHLFQNVKSFVTELLQLFCRIYLNHHSVHFYVIPF